MKLVLALCPCTVSVIPLRSACALSHQARDMPERRSAFISATIAAASSTETRALRASKLTPQ
jgi:hypothetical protein